MTKKKIFVSFKVIFLAKIGNFGVVALQPHQFFKFLGINFFLVSLDTRKNLLQNYRLGFLIHFFFL